MTHFKVQGVIPCLLLAKKVQRKYWHRRRVGMDRAHGAIGRNPCRLGSGACTCHLTLHAARPFDPSLLRQSRPKRDLATHQVLSEVSTETPIWSAQSSFETLHMMIMHTVATSLNCSLRCSMTRCEGNCCSKSGLVWGEHVGPAGAQK